MGSGRRWMRVGMGSGRRWLRVRNGKWQEVAENWGLDVAGGG
jgi:hypothetical protein